MKKTLIALMAMLLVAVMALTFAACGGEEAPEAEKPVTYVSKYESKGKHQELTNMVSWEGINAIPIKTTDMNIDEARQLCVDFFRYAKTAAWIPSDNYDIWAMR